MSGKYPRYPAYKDSGVEWLGDVPVGWKLGLGKRLFEQKRDPAFDSDDQLSATQKYGVIPQRLFMALEDQKVTLALAGTDGFKHINKNDFVISLRSFQGGIEWSKYSGCVSPAYTVLRMARAKENSPAFWAYLLKSSAFISKLRSVTEGIRDGKNISYEQFSGILLPVPDLSEQQAIATFLDAETARIDALISEYQKLITLLKEKRQALISHAVTKGLNPDAPMKDSGVQWLGEVPEHWGVCKLSYRFLVNLGKMLDEKRATGKYPVPYLRNQDVQQGRIQTEDLPVMDIYPEEYDRYTVRAGDLLVCEGGDVGRAAIWHGAPIGYQKALHRLRPTAGDLAEFMYYLMMAAKHRGLFAENDSKATISHLTAETFRSYIFPFPPLPEQQAIAAYLDQETARMDALVQQAETGIDLLKERRTTLISDAVTGKIDVRGNITMVDSSC